MARHGKAGTARHGAAGLGETRQARQAGRGGARLGSARQGRHSGDFEMSSKKRIAAMKFAFRNGARFGVDADTAGMELERIRASSGSLVPQEVVEASRPDDAPLHPAFEWDDEKAANGYRTWQARKLIRSVQVIEQRDGGPVQVPVYVHVPQPAVREEAHGGAEKAATAQAGYQPVSVVVKRPDMYAAALADLNRRVNSAKAALSDLQEAAQQSPETDQERMARIAIAVQAMSAAQAAVSALH